MKLKTNFYFSVSRQIQIDTLNQTVHYKNVKVTSTQNEPLHKKIAQSNQRVNVSSGNISVTTEQTDEPHNTTILQSNKRISVSSENSASKFLKGNNFKTPVVPSLTPIVQHNPALQSPTNITPTHQISSNITELVLPSTSNAGNYSKDDSSNKKKLIGSNLEESTHTIQQGNNFHSNFYFSIFFVNISAAVYISCWHIVRR